MINVIVSGYFNPVGTHHLKYIDAAYQQGRALAWPWERVKLHIIVNNDKQVSLKGSCPFQYTDERKKIIQKLYPKATVYFSKSSTDDVSYDIFLIVCDTMGWDAWPNRARKTIFCNGGDRSIHTANSFEIEECNKFNIEMRFGVGGVTKTGSSSNLIEKAAKWWVANKMEQSSN